MKTAYAIASGEYSDYRILAVAHDEKTAEAWAVAVRGWPESWHSDARVEPILLLDSGEPVVPVHRVDLSQDWWNDGTTGELRVDEQDELPISSLYGAPPARPSVRFVRAPCHRGKGGRIEVRGRTTKAVLKVYSEQKAMWTADPRGFKEVNR